VIRRLIAIVCLLSVVGCGVEGIHSANPKTVIRINPWSKSLDLENNKDVNVVLDSAIFNPETGQVEITGLTITDTASIVRASNVPQIEMIGVQARAIGDAWATGMAAGAQLVRELVPMLGGFAPNPIWGEGQPGAVPKNWIYIGPGSPHTQPADTPDG